MDMGSIGIMSAIIVSIAINIWLARRQESRYNTQMERQTKVDSAKLTHKLLGAWRTKGWFTNLLYKIRDPDAVPDEIGAYAALDLFENIAVWWSDGTLDERHVKEFFGTSLNDARNNHAMMNFMDTLRNKDSEHYYVNLAKLLDRVKEWNIKSQFSGGCMPPDPPLTKSR